MAGASRGNAVFTVVVTALVLLCAVPMSLIVGSRALRGSPSWPRSWPPSRSAR